jgi:hypothetical protein
MTTTFLTLMVASTVALAGAASASALSPWWGLTMAQRPTNLQPGSARDEVQQLTVSASAGKFTLTRSEGPGVEGSVELLFNVTHEALQSALEGIYGTGNVEVTGGPGNTAGSQPYAITFVGELADQPIAMINGTSNLSGGRREARVVRVTSGRPDGQVVLFAENLGDAVLNAVGSPVRIVDSLPAGLTAVGISASEPQPGGENARNRFPCSVASLTCTFSGSLAPYDELEVRIDVLATGGLSGETNRAGISGGQAPPASITHKVTAGELTRFGVEDYGMTPEEEGGAPATQAGSHPFQLTTTVALDQGPDTGQLGGGYADVEPVALTKDINAKLPPGLIGDPTVLPQCKMTQFLTFAEGGSGNFAGDECPANTAVGVATVVVNEPASLKASISFVVPIFDLEPGFGEPARFGFYVPIIKAPVLLDTALRSGPGEDYGITVSALDITEPAGFLSSTLTFWGTPGNPSHDNSRGWGCLEATRGGKGFPCSPLAAHEPPPFLTLPTTCAGPMQSSVNVDSWLEPLVPVPGASNEPMQTLDGCGRLPFSPTLQATPTSDSASSPSGLDVNLEFHDEGLRSDGGVAQSHLKDTTVTLPEGFTINPSAGVGLSGCTAADYARETLTSAPGTGCPNESKLGTVSIETPLLTQKIEGSIFIAQPHENPFDSLVALYVVAKNRETGVLIKLAGKVTPNPVTGQLVTTFENNPQLPFDHFNFHFREGQQAPLVTPARCGTYTTTAGLTPWSEPTDVLADASSFTITSGVGGGVCPSGGVPPFSPQIQSGTLNNNAGAFSAFYLHLTRSDAESEISGFSTDLPAGLTGDLTGIPFCPEVGIAQARAKTGAQEETSPSCPAASQIGHTLVGTGVGAVLAYVPGKIYLAGPYNGDPFSLVSVTSAVVGPFDLGTVVLRFGLRIDPLTARVSVDPSSSEPIPTIIDGIVTHVRDIRVYIDRQNFTLNPTSCNPLAIASTLGSNLGQSTTIASPFQAANCANLGFAPKFAVTTSGKNSKANGASLNVKLSFPTGAFGTQANISRVKVELPKQLPSRLTTLQKACTAAQFNANPAGCPAASVIGHARAVTPILPVPLEGPAYFVSNGGEAFPNLIMVLQGYGVTIDLVGSTFISKQGVTSSTFKTVPDQPVSSFELTLPQGPYSALTALGNLCTSRLSMPTEFVGQNGMTLHRTTLVGVSGCPKQKTLTRAQKLAIALKACHKKHGKAKRQKCERAARKKYGAVKPKKKKKS